MPYHLVKTPKGWFVENKETGKRYSNTPITLEKAQSQLSILNRSLRKEDFNKTQER